MSCMLALGSISIANKLLNPFTLLASLPNFCENASDKLCAGSVELRVDSSRSGTGASRGAGAGGEVQQEAAEGRGAHIRRTDSRTAAS